MIGEIVSDFASTITRLRPSGSSSDGGRFVRGTMASTSVQAAVVPVTGDDTARLPEGLRKKAKIKFYSQVEFFGVEDDPEDAREADQVSYLGKLWECQLVKDWQIQGGFYEVVAVLITGAADADAVFFGSAEEFDTDALTSVKTPTATPITFTADAGVGEFLWFAWPSTNGDPVFSFNGFVGGFVQDADVEIDSVDYTTYRSVHTGLGNTTVTVTRGS